MPGTSSLIQSGATTARWLSQLRGLLPNLSYREARFYASFRTDPRGAAIAYLNPSKNGIRLFLPLQPYQDGNLHPTPSTSSWAKRFPSVYPIASDDQLEIAGHLIHRAAAHFQRPMIDIEVEDLSDSVLDEAIRADRLRFGVVSTGDHSSLVRQRKGQDRLRTLTLLNYDSRCAVCEIDNPSLLVASHIVGWAEAPESRGLLSNVLCLCCFHDVLFERGFWSLADDLGIVRTRAVAPLAAELQRCTSLLAQIGKGERGSRWKAKPDRIGGGRWHPPE